MGYWPAKLPTLLNIVLMVSAPLVKNGRCRKSVIDSCQVGYCTIDAIIAGQMLSAVNGGSMSIAVGIVVVQIVCWIVAVFGMKFFHYYERY